MRLGSSCLGEAALQLNGPAGTGKLLILGVGVFGTLILAGASEARREALAYHHRVHRRSVDRQLRVLPNI